MRVYWSNNGSIKADLSFGEQVMTSVISPEISFVIYLFFHCFAVLVGSEN